jgi:integrase
MGSKWFTGGVVAAPRGRIQFDFRLDGVRYRPTIKRPPSEANLRRARERLEVIKRKIEAGTFSFADEFPDYRFLPRLSGAYKVRLCDDVFDAYLAHCEARVGRDDLASATLGGYRKVLDGVWRPQIGQLWFYDVTYSQLVAIADKRDWSKKTYNNALSVLRRAFDFGYRDRPLEANPARGLRGARLRKTDRPKVDPFSMHDAETLIAAIHRDWGEAQGNYDEFRFFTGLRPSEQIALVLTDLDVKHGIISISKARVSGVDRCKTKTGEDRRVELCPRALKVLKRQLLLRERLAAAGTLDHNHVFVRDDGKPMRDLQVAAIRWRKTLQSLKVRYRRPYTARHSSVSWNLMIGEEELWVSKQHGHSPVTMMRIYAAWADGAVKADLKTIKRSMGYLPPPKPSHRPRKPHRGGGRYAGDVHASTDGLTVVQSVPTTIEKLRQMAFAARDARVQSPTACSSRKNRAEPCRTEGGWGGRIRTYVWRDQNPLPYRLATPQHSKTGEVFKPRATKLVQRSGTRAATRSASAARSKSANTHAPVPVRRAAPNRASQSSASATSGKRARTTLSQSLRPPVWKRARIVIFGEFRVNSGAWKTAAVGTCTRG